MENRGGQIFRSPLRYPGGKSCIYKFMTHFLLENDLVGLNYAEPYAGGAGLALRLMMDEYVNDIYINDLDPSIYAFWYAILNQPDEMCRWLLSVDVTVENWKYYKEIQHRYKTVDLIELAQSTFFLNRTNVSGVISGGLIGGFNQLGKYKIDARFNKRDLLRRIEDIQLFSHRIHLSNRDGIDFIKEIDAKKEGIFVYLDPPYYQKGADLYLNAFKDADHKALSVFVKQMKKNWLVSYDNHEFIMHLYEEKQKVLYQLSQCPSNRVGDEVLIFDDRMQFNNSICFLSSPVAL